MHREGTVRTYTHATAQVQVSFPEGEECCRRCPFCTSDSRNHKREACFLTGVILYLPDLSRDEGCPLIFMDNPTNDKRE